MSTELLPCPFCGGAAEMHEYDFHDAHEWRAFAECTDCGAKSEESRAGNRMGCFEATNGLHKQRAAIRWNQRANPAASKDEPVAGEREGWKEAAIAWEVCASIHRTWAKCKDALYKTRQSDFLRHAEKARTTLNAPAPLVADASEPRKATMEQMQKWADDGTLAERVWRTLRDQEREITALEKAKSPQPEPLTDAQVQAVRDAVAEALGDAYDCGRVWSAWSYGTMGPDDFSSVAEDADRVAEIADAAIAALFRVVAK